MQWTASEIKHKDGEAQPLIMQSFVDFKQSTHYIQLQNTVQALKVLSLNFVTYFLVLKLI